MKYIIASLIILLTGINTNAQKNYGVDSIPVDYRVGVEYELAPITFRGIGNLKPTTLALKTGLVPGQRIKVPGNEISQAIRKLWESGVFASIDVQVVKRVGNVIFLEFVVERIPRLGGTPKIKGGKKSDKDEIQGIVGLFNGDPVTMNKKQKIINLISDFYVEKGYLNTKVFIKEVKDPEKSGYVNLEIEITRGKKVKIGEILFEGVQSTEEWRLRKALKETKEKPQIHWEKILDKENRKESLPNVIASLSLKRIHRFVVNNTRPNIFSSAKFQEDEFATDKQAIISHYNSLGYRDAMILKDSIYVNNNGDLGIKIFISEGNKYYFREILWEGNTMYSDAELNKILGIKSGDTYDQSRLQSKLFFDMGGNDISSRYMDKGHLFFNITPVEQGVTGDSIDLVLKMYEGPVAVIRNIIIKGNTKTNEKVIRRVLRTRPGNVFSRTDIIRSTQEIQALNLFDPEQLGIVPIPHPEDGTVDIEYTLVEKPSDQLQLSAGWGGANTGLFVSAGIQFNNFSARNVNNWSAWAPLPVGDGQKLGLQVYTNGRFYQSYRFNFLEPWLGGKKPNNFSVSLNYSLQHSDTHQLSSPLASYISNFGASVGYGKRLKFPDDYFSLNFFLNYQNYRVQNYSALVLSDGVANNLNFKTILSRTNLSGNPNFLSSGSRISLAMELTPPYSLIDPSIEKLSFEEQAKKIEYHKWRFDAEWYLKLLGRNEQGKRKLVLKTQVKAGFLGRYNANMPLSAFERYQLGGDGLSNFGSFQLVGYESISLRGTKNPFYPVGIADQINLSESDKNAAIFNKFSMELRYPLSLSPASTIYGILFAEAGNSYASFQHYDPTNLRRSVGIGVRAILPLISMIGFDWGIGFDEPGNQGASLGDLMRNGVFQIRLGFEPD